MSQGPAAGLNLGFGEFDRRARVEENWRRFHECLGAECFHRASLQQIHSAAVYQVVEATSGMLQYRPAGLPEPGGGEDRSPPGDALLTDQACILLSVRSADCMPLLLVDSKRRAVAAVHAGWRGAVDRIVEKTVGEMQRLFASRPRDLVAAIGPSIRVCCYEVGEEVRDKFCSRFNQGGLFFQTAAPSSASAPAPFLAGKPPGRERLDVHLDLVAVARAQLESAGVLRANIEVAEFCTACRTDLFFSYRKEGNRTGRTVAVVGIRPEKVRSRRR